MAKQGMSRPERTHTQPHNDGLIGAMVAHKKL